MLGDECFFKGETASQKRLCMAVPFYYKIVNGFITSRLSSLSQDLFLAVACFAGEIGGNMDLFLRSSVLTVCEFEHFVIYICHICHKKESIMP